MPIRKKELAELTMKKMSNSSNIKVSKITSMKWKKSVKTSIFLIKNVRIVPLYKVSATKLSIIAWITSHILLECAINVCHLLWFWIDKHIDMLTMFHLWILRRCRNLLELGNKLDFMSKEWAIFMGIIQKIQTFLMALESTLKQFMSPHRLVKWMEFSHWMIHSEQKLTWLLKLWLLKG